MSDEDKPVSPAESGAEPPAATPAVEPWAQPASATAENAAEPSLTPAAPNPVPEPEAAPAVPAAPATRKGGAGVLVAALLGGAIAFVAGFGLSHYNVLNLRSEPDMSALNARLAALDQSVTEEKTALAEVRQKADAAAAAAAAATPDLSALTTRIDALEKSLAAAAKASDSGVTPAALAALQDQVDALKNSGGDTRAIVQEELKAWQADAVRKATTEAAAAKAAALKEAAFVALKEQVASGAPYASALGALDLATPPEALAKHAETGLPTLADLRAGFPDAARAALAAVPATDEGFWGFLRQQVGARALTPQQGTSPDAILSRAEAGLAAGDISAALGELAALPSEAQSAMADWTAQAQDRLAAEQALAALPAPTAP